MNAEDALLAWEEKPRKREQQADVQQDQGQKRPRIGDRRDEKRPKPSGGRFTSFTPQNAPIDQVLIQIKDKGTLTFPGKLKSDPSKRPRDKYCRFHRDHGYDTTDCYDLKQQIEALIRQGKLQKFINKERVDPNRQEPAPRWDNECLRPPIGDIRMIVGGTTTIGSSKKARKTYLRSVQNVQLIGSAPNTTRMESPIIGFSEEDARRLHYPHDDELVVSIRVGDYNVHRVLIDKGSSVDILYYPAFQQMGIDRVRLIPTSAPLVGFGGTRVFPIGSITLSVTVDDYPQELTRNVMFLVVDCSSAYNGILGRPTLNSWKTATLTYHLMIKFPTDHGIGELRENQVAAWECYIAMLEMEDHHQTMCVEEQRTVAEPVEELEEITLDESKPERTTRIGTMVGQPVRQALAAFLRRNQDVFAWSHKDMPGIDPSVMVHKLNVKPATPPVRQKKRVFAHERDLAIAEEVRKLLEAGFIREVYYPEWLANVVMVKKASGKWRMCVDFTDLNKACPKDSYLLPLIDALVDSTARHQLLSFMDAFSGYNQIKMKEADQEKTSFVTSQGLFCYKVMPFRLKNAGATYQRLMNKMFTHQIERNVQVYVDDMLVKSLHENDHLNELQETFDTLRSYNMKLNPSKCVFGVTAGKFLGFMVSQRGIKVNPEKIRAIMKLELPRTVKDVQSLNGKVAALNRFISKATDKCLPFFRILRKSFEWIDECQKAFEDLKKYLTSPPSLSPSKPGEDLYLYLAVSRVVVSAALVREEEGTQRLVYFISRGFRGAEERYLQMEKLAFALVTAARKLKPYFQVHTIIVLTDNP
ncbi:uncharacterized protein LOC136064949 [Quercus suber]|uniref:uncharacterized protein LOC136064949 n=1 Tax=Quercus suber TaxID=58331 RepID=UPI0032DEE32F